MADSATQRLSLLPLGRESLRLKLFFRSECFLKHVFGCYSSFVATAYSQNRPSVSKYHVFGSIITKRIYTGQNSLCASMAVRRSLRVPR